jgi:hypothetical protein
LVVEAEVDEGLMELEEVLMEELELELGLTDDELELYEVDVET